MHYTATATYTDTETIEGVPSYTVVAIYEGDAPALDGAAEQPLLTPGAETADPDAAAFHSDSKSGIAGLIALGRFFSLGAFSKAGAATIAAIAAAALTIVSIGVYTRRRVSESSGT